MKREELKQLWGEILRSTTTTVGQYENLAQNILDTYHSDETFRGHIKNRSGRVTETTGQAFDEKNFDLAMARAFIADELGFTGWERVIDAVERGGKYPMLFQYATAALWRGDFTALEQNIGRDRFDDQIREWFEKGYFENESVAFNEVFAAACWLGHAKTTEYLLDKGIDPYAGMRTGLSGFHWAASSGKLDVIKLLIERRVPMEVKSMYDSTVLGQALWSAVNEHTADHAAIVEALINAGAYVWPNTLEWWNETQNPPSSETQTRITEALLRAKNR